MSVLRKPQEFFEGELSRLLKRPLSRRKTFSLGDPTTPTLLGVTSPKNTAIVAKYDGVAHVICYDRQVLSTWIAPTLAVMSPMQITPVDPKTTYELFDDFDRKYQLGILKEHLVDEPIDVTTGTVKFTLNDLNPWFTGTITVPVIKVFAGTAGVVFDIDWRPTPFEYTFADVQRLYPSITQAQYDTRADATLMTYGLDYSAQNTALAAITPWATFDVWTNISSAQATSLANALKAVDTVAWINGASGAAFNLANCGVIYNGPTLGFAGLCRQLADTVAVDGMFDQLYAKFDNIVNKDFENVLIAIINMGFGAGNLKGAVIAHYGGKTRNYATLTDVLPAPSHHWPLVEDGRNVATPASPMDVTGWPKRVWPSYETMMTLPNPALTYPLGVTLNTAGDFTLSFRYHRASNEIAGTYCIFNANSTETSGAVFNGTGGRFYLGGSVAVWEANALGARPRGGTVATITIVKEGNLAYIYRDGQLVATFTAASLVLKTLTHLGRASYNFQGIDSIGDIMFWPQALNAKQVAKIKPTDRQLVRT